MTAATVLWVNGTPLPVPAYKGYTTRREELVKAERNVGGVIGMAIEGAIYDAEAGELIKHHIAWKYTIEAKWVGLTYAEKNTIMSATAGEWFNVDFVDLDTDTLIQGVKMYRGSGQQVTGWGHYDPATMRFKYYDITMSLVQK